MPCSRRTFLAGAAATTILGGRVTAGARQTAPAGERPRQDAGPRVLLPRTRVPLSFIIDDSTCLVNMGHFCLPQFATAWPERDVYQKPWKSWPREIPDAFVRQFGEWCAEHGVKGKYSVVPNPACVGWLDRELPGWSRRELQASLRLVRELMLPDWDIHPEMITHTRVIDLATGRPLPEINAGTMENSYPQEDKSVDELTAYLAYALRILKNCDLPCEGITTPGGFGNRVKPELSLAVQQAVRDVYAAEIPHYFKYVSGGDQSTEPSVEHVSGLGTSQLQLTVNVPAGTGDWFGGWTGDDPSQGHRYTNDEATRGRMVELIEQNRPAVMLCHWPGMYSHGSLEGFRDFQRVVTAIHGRFADRTIWMKVSEMARYWATKELAEIRVEPQGVVIDSPFDCPDYTLELPRRAAQPPVVAAGDRPVPIREVNLPRELQPSTFWRDRERTVLCLSLTRGRTSITAQ